MVQLPRFETSVFMHPADAKQSGTGERKTPQEDTMARTSATTAQDQGWGSQAVRSRVISDRPNSAIQSKYKAVRSGTSALAANISAEDQMVQSCPEASPMKW